MSASGQKPYIPWKRFWCRDDEAIHMGDDRQGFLSDPDGEYTNLYNPDLVTLEQVLSEPCLILCGDPGSGKSTVLRHARPAFENSLEESRNLIQLDFRDIPTVSVFTKRTFESVVWQRWRNGNGKLLLVIDGVDEGLLKIPDFVGYLTGQLRDEPLNRLKLVMACRSAEWPVSQGNDLISLWGQFEKLPKYELCPLRQRDVEVAAEKWGLDKHAFIQAVYEKSVVGLAALPSTLLFLLDEFSESSGFSGTHRELYERGCQRLARELDPRRAELVRQLRKTARVSSPQEIYTTAGRIAALLLVCGKSAIHTGALDEADMDNDLHLSVAADDSVTEDVILDAIGSGLFTSRGPSRFGFAHQTFAECLAAQYLSRLEIVQIRSLLCAHDSRSEYIIPQLAETAAWLAGIREDFFDYLCKTEPEVLLRSDVTKVQILRKSALVAAVLEKTKNKELFDERNIGRFFDTLAHPGISGQLRPYIADKSFHTVVRRMAMSIAGDCKVAGLTDDLLGIVRDASELQQIREWAASALTKVVPESRLTELIPLALGQAGADPDDSIRGYAIRELVPNTWSISQALPAIHSPRNTNFFGSYWSLLKYHLPLHLVVTDLPLVLGRMIRWTHCFDTLSWMAELADAAYLMALKNLDKRGIRKLAVRVWVVKQQRHHPLPHHRDSSIIKLFESDVNLKREFITAIVNDPATPSHDVFIVNGFYIKPFTQNDFEWALNQITTSPTNRREAWVTLISSIAYLDTISRFWDLFLQRIEEISELKARFHHIRAWNLDEKLAQEAKAAWLTEQEYKKKLDQPKLSFDAEKEIQTTFADVSAGKTFRWIDLCHLLALEKNETRIWHLKHDVTEYPGWLNADELRRNAIRAAARAFILNHNDGYSQMGAPTNYFDPGYVAIWLLRNEIRADAALKKAVATNWVEALVGRFNSGSDHTKQSAKLAYELSPDVTINAFIREAEEEGKKHDYIFCLNRFKEAWDKRFTGEAINLIRQENFKNSGIESILTFLAAIDPNASGTCAKELLDSCDAADPTLQDRVVCILVSCLGSMPSRTWNFTWPLLEADNTLAEKVLLRVANRHDYDRQKFLPDLTEKQLGDLCLKLYTLFPLETDPPHKNGFSGVSSRKGAQWFRNDVASALEARCTQETCQELLRLARALPQHSEWFLWRHYNARVGQRRISWCPPSPEAVLSIAKYTEGRLVRDENDLLEVVIESLARYQTQLTQNTLPRSDALWLWDGSDPKRTNFRPKDEAFLSDEIARWLRDDLNRRGIVIGREVQPRRGQRTDIYVEAVARDSSEPALRTITVVIEVKGCWNPSVRTSVDSQLVGSYLRPNGLTHGIYVVGWFVCAKWTNSQNKLSSGTLDSARQEVNQLAAAHDGKSNPERVHCVVLDCAYPA